MDDTTRLIYNEIVLMRKDIKSCLDKMDERLTSLEKFRDKAIGILVCVGVGIRYCWDYLKERIV